jgi:hypothetical protein
MDRSMDGGIFVNDNSDSLEELWEMLLSRDPDLIRAAFGGLSPEEQAVVLQHLSKMAAEDGWHPEQVISAKAALEALL